MSNGVFVVFAIALMEDAFKSMNGDFTGIWHKPMRIKKEKQNRYLVLRDFTYKHVDQDINHGVYRFKKGQVIKLRLEDPQYFMPDRSNLKLLGKTRF